MASPKEVELTGIQKIDPAWKPETPDSKALLKDMGIVDVTLLDSYRIKTPEEYIVVGRISLKAHENIKTIEARWDAEVRRRHQLHTMATAARGIDLKLPADIKRVADRELIRWDNEQARLKAVEQARLDREEAEKARVAQAEADRIQKEAEAAAAKLRREGEMSQAREVVAQAQQQAAQVVEEAEQSVGVILADTTPKLAGLGSMNKWKGREVVKEDDPDWGILQVMKAIVEGRYPLRHLIKGESLRLIDFAPSVLNELGNRQRKQNLGCPGIEGYSSLSKTHRASEGSGW